MTDTVRVERRGPVAIVTMNLPKRRNALGPALYPVLGSTLEALQNERELRALVLHGGEQFCAGGDILGLEGSALRQRHEMGIGHRIVRALAAGRLPTIAAVEGNAYGGGFSMALACDFVVADPQTTFCAAFGKVGLMPDYGLLWSLPKRVGIGLAREIMMLCEPIPGAQAKSFGLVDRLVEPGQVLDTALGLAERLAAASPGSIATTKSVLARAPMPMDSMLAWEADIQGLLLDSADFAEGVQAFQQKRKPQFSGD